MLKLFKFTCGIDEKIGVFKDAGDAYDRRTEVDATFHYLPVQIDEIVVPGYEVTIKPIEAAEEPKTPPTPPTDDEFTAMDKPALIALLKDKGVDYRAQWGEPKLREAARAWKAAQ